MREPESNLRHRRDNRLLVAAAIAVFLVWGGIYLSPRNGEPFDARLFAGRVPLFVLWYLDVTLIAATLFVIFRALVKLFLDRRRGVLGARLRTRLLVMNLGLTLLPVTLLFLAATNFLQSSVDRWFSTPVEKSLEGADALRDLADRRTTDDARREARALAQDLDTLPPDAAIEPLFAREIARRGYASLELYPAGGTAVRIAGVAGTLPPLFPAEELARAARDGQAAAPAFRPDGSRYFRAAERSHRGIVVASLLVPRTEAATGDVVAKAFSDYRKLEVQKPAIQATSLLLFTLLTLALLFAAIWAGLTLARRLTAPIEALAESARRIALGDLTAEVNVAASDELGVLVDSFNTMTAEVRENRGRLESSNRELVDSNERLRRERELLSTILRTARTGIVALDDDETVRLANPAALEILGLDETPGSLAELAAREDLAPIAEAVAAARRGGSPLPREIAVGNLAPRRRAEISVAAMPGEAGAGGGFVVAIEDTTEVARAQRLAAWSDAARRVAHEIKNPLTPIRLSAERMVKKMNAGDADAPEAVRQGAALIVDEVNLLKSLVDQFARFARMPESRPVPTDLAALAERTVALYRGAREGVAIELSNQLPRRDYTVDPEQIQRALANLLDNAIEAAGDGGSIVVSLAERRSTVTIVISDNGAGISPADRERIFLPDFSTKPGGSGLGLAIVSRIIADHRGTIHVEENRPRGARFVIEIPAA